MATCLQSHKPYCVTLQFTNTTTRHRRLHRYVFNGSMSVALRLKFQSDPRCNLAWEKWRKHKTSSSFSNTKVYSLVSLLVVIEKRETESEKLVHRFTRHKTLYGERVSEREQTQTLILSVVALARACSLCLSSQLCSVCEISSQSSSIMGAVIFGIFTSSHLVPYWFFSFFLFRVYSNGSSVWASFSQSESVTDLLLIFFDF